MFVNEVSLLGFTSIPPKLHVEKVKWILARPPYFFTGNNYESPSHLEIMHYFQILYLYF